MGTGWAVGSFSQRDCLGYEFAAGNVPLLTENIVPVFSCRDKANDGDLAGNVLCQPGAGFTSCGVAVKAEEHFSGVLAFRKKTGQGLCLKRRPGQGSSLSASPADKGR